MAETLVNNAQMYLGRSSRARSGSVCRRRFVPANSFLALLSTWYYSDDRFLMPLAVAQSVHPRYHAALNTRTTNRLESTHPVCVYMFVYVGQVALLSVVCGRRKEYTAADKLCSSALITNLSFSGIRRYNARPMLLHLMLC